MRMSQANAKANPAPTAGPGRAAMVGLRTETSAPVRRRCRSCRSATRSSWDIASFVLSRFAPMPLTLPPAQNAVPAPVSSSAPTSRFSPQTLIMLRSAGVRLSDIALRASGRFSVMTATRSRITQSSSSVPVSILVSVVMVPPVIVILVIPAWSEGPDPKVRDSGFDAAHRPGMTVLKLLHPRPQFQFPGPGAARLLQHVPVAQRNGVGIEHRVGPVGGFRPRSAADTAVDDEVRDVDALRRQLARHALGEAAQREL